MESTNGSFNAGQEIKLTATLADLPSAATSRRTLIQTEQKRSLPLASLTGKLLQSNSCNTRTVRSIKTVTGSFVSPKRVNLSTSSSLQSLITSKSLEENV